MKTIWEMFDSALGGIASVTVLYDIHERRYTIICDGRTYTVDVHQVHQDILRLRLSPCRNGHTCAGMLKANGIRSFWKFALLDNAPILQTELFATDVEHAREIICGLSVAQENLNIDATEVPDSDTSNRTDDDLRIQRMRLALEADVLKFVSSGDGSHLLEIRHGGAKSTYQVKCRMNAVQEIVELRALISSRQIATDEGRYFLLQRCRDLVGCRVALDENDLPYVVAFFPFSMLERDNVATRVEMFTEAMFQLRHVECFNDQSVRNIYQQLNMKGYNNGNSGSCN